MNRTLLLHGAVRTLPDRALVLLAAALAPTAEVANDPGWTFASAGERTSREARTRRVLWHEAARRRLNRPVTVAWVDGLRLRLYLGTDLTWCVYVGGAYEPNELTFLSRVLGPGMTFVDGGAHEGLYSLLAWRRTRPGGHVIAFEPSTEASARLSANLALNRAESVSAHKMALGDRCRQTDLALAAYGHDGQNTVGLHIANPQLTPNTAATPRGWSLPG